MFLERPVSQRVELGFPARLNCTVNGTLATPPEWRLGGSALTSVAGEVEVEASYLLLPSVQWSQIGEYTCVVTVEGNSSSASATVNITGKAQEEKECSDCWIRVHRICKAVRGRHGGSENDQSRDRRRGEDRVSRGWVSWTEHVLLGVLGQ